MGCRLGFPRVSSSTDMRRSILLKDAASLQDQLKQASKEKAMLQEELKKMRDNAARLFILTPISRLNV